MAEETKRPKKAKVSRRLEYRRSKREKMPAGPGEDRYGDDDGDTGSAGVREPRHPKPLGPLADAGELPLPEPPLMVSLPDPRR